MSSNLKEDLDKIYQDLRQANLNVPAELNYQPTDDEIRALDRGVTDYYNKLWKIEDKLKEVIDALKCGEYDST